MMYELKLSVGTREEGRSVDVSWRRAEGWSPASVGRGRLTDGGRAVERKVGREVDDVGAVAGEDGRHAAAGLEGKAQARDAGADGERLRARAGREGDGARGRREDERVELVLRLWGGKASTLEESVSGDEEQAKGGGRATHVFAPGGRADRVGVRGREDRVRAGHEVDLVLLDGRVDARPERLRVVGRDGEQGRVVETVDPRLRVGLGAGDRADVRRLAGGEGALGVSCSAGRRAEDERGKGRPRRSRSR